MSKLTQKRMAEIVGVTRMTLASYLKNPQKMPVGAYIKLIEHGVDLPPLPSYKVCDKCEGSGRILANPKERN